MSDYKFKQIKQNVLEWSQYNIQKQLSKRDYIEITKNEKNILLIDLTFEYCLAQIVISELNFAPYQYVSFEAMTLDSQKAKKTGQPERVYFFYDSVDMLKDMVLEELSLGVKISSEYIPNQLQEKYINRKGKLTINNKKLYHIMHPDDAKKYNKDLYDNIFTCIDIESQYLVLESNFISLRALPEVFTIL